MIIEETKMKKYEMKKVNYELMLLSRLIIIKA